MTVLLTRSAVFSGARLRTVTICRLSAARELEPVAATGCVSLGLAPMLPWPRGYSSFACSRKCPTAGLGWNLLGNSKSISLIPRKRANFTMTQDLLYSRRVCSPPRRRKIQWSVASGQ